MLAEICILTAHNNLTRVGYKFPFGLSCSCGFCDRRKVKSSRCLTQLLIDVLIIVRSEYEHAIGIIRSGVYSESKFVS